MSALRSHELFPYAVWGLFAMAAIAAAALLSALAVDSRSSAKAPIESAELRTGSDEIVHLKERIDALLAEQQRLARRVAEFERTQNDLTATTPVDRRDVAWAPPPLPYGLKVPPKAAPAPQPVPAETPRDKDATIPVPPLPPREKDAAVPLAPPRDKDTALALVPPPPPPALLRERETPAGPARATDVPRIIDLPADTTETILTRAEFALDLGGETTLDGLRARWAALRGNHGQALENLRPLVVLREAGQPGAFDFRLIVGPIANAADAARICARLNTPKIICAVTTFDGQHFELR